MRLEDLTLGDFASRVGDRFALVGAPDVPELELVSAESLGDRPGGRNPFSLIFGGPPQPVLPQSIYRLEHAELGALEVFIVPIAGGGDRTSYEAIFT